MIIIIILFFSKKIISKRGIYAKKIIVKNNTKKREKSPDIICLSKSLISKNLIKPSHKQLKDNKIVL